MVKRIYYEGGENIKKRTSIEEVSGEDAKQWCVGGNSCEEEAH